MDSYSCTKICSSSSLASHDQHEEKKEKPYLSTLHKVRSLPLKSSINKKPIAPMPPIPPKVYTVEVVNFRQVVQLLTTAPEFQSHYNSISGSGHLHDQVAPPPPAPPRDFSPTSLSSNNTNIGGQWREFLPPSSTVVISIDDDSDESTDEKDVGPQIPTESTIFGACDTSPLSILQLPSPLAWCSSLLLSPDTLTFLDLSTII